MQKNQSKKKAEISKRKRTLTRFLAIQIFYQFEFYDKKTALDEIKENTINHHIFDENDEIGSCQKKIDANFLDDLLNLMIVNIDEIDKEIAAFLHKDKNNSRLLSQLLRFAALELKLFKDTPFKVIIDEYVEISSHFFEESRVNFVNSILQNLAKKYRDNL